MLVDMHRFNHVGVASEESVRKSDMHRMFITEGYKLGAGLNSFPGAEVKDDHFPRHVKMTVTAPDKTRLKAASRDILKSLDQLPSSGSSFSKAPEHVFSKTQSSRTTVFSTPGISKMQYESNRARTNNRTGNDGIWNVTLVNKNGNVDGNDGCLEPSVRFGFDQPNTDTRLDTWLEDARTRARSPALGHTPLTQLRTSPTSLISPDLGRTKLSPSKAGQADAINRNGDVTGDDELLESRVGFGFDQPNTDTRLDTWLEDALRRV
ncbi:hypothetical protein FB446DRAFT_437822 [Lentinula raphanica]|nr:hypothetical protein FB446DRAFT_437822 [Lentinula raphanica]